MRKKSFTNVKLKEWIVVQENQSGKKVKKLRSDNGGEYVNNEMGAWLKNHGVEHQKIPKESPQSNGVAERMNRTLQDRARSMLHGSGLGGGFWVEAISAASYIRNRGLVAGLSKTPDELWSGTVPTIKHLKAYGSKAYVSLEHHKRKGKMGSTKWEGVVVGYPHDSVSTECGIQFGGAYSTVVYHRLMKVLDLGGGERGWIKILNRVSLLMMICSQFSSLEMSEVWVRGRIVMMMITLTSPSWWRTAVMTRI